MKTFSCKKCTFAGDSPTVLREHDRKVHLKKGKKKFSSENHASCKLCDFTYSRTISLSRHMKTAHDKKDEKKKELVSREGKKKDNKGQPNNDFQSYFDFCDKKNKGRKNKTNCRKCDGCLTKDDCGTCRFCKDKTKFGGPNTLRKKCEKRVCFKATKEHQKRSCQDQDHDQGQDQDHAKEVYACKFCDYTYSRISSLSRHMKTVHLTVYDFRCEMCDCQTRDLGQLMRHRDSVHGGSKSSRQKECEFAMMVMSQGGTKKGNHKRNPCKAKVPKVTRPSCIPKKAEKKKNPMSAEIRKILEDLIQDLPYADVLAPSPSPPTCVPKEDENEDSQEGDKKRVEDEDESDVSKSTEEPQVDLSETSSSTHASEKDESEDNSKEDDSTSTEDAQKCGQAKESENNMAEPSPSHFLEEGDKNRKDNSMEVHMPSSGGVSIVTQGSETHVSEYPSSSASEEQDIKSSEGSKSQEGPKCQNEVAKEAERLENDELEKERETNYFECTQCKYATTSMEEFEFHNVYIHKPKDVEKDKEKEKPRKVSKRKRKTENSKSNESGYFSSESVLEEHNLDDGRRAIKTRRKNRGKQQEKRDIFKVTKEPRVRVKVEKVQEDYGEESFDHYKEEEEGEIEFCDLCDFGTEEKGGLTEHVMSSHMTDYYTMSCLGFRWQFFGN